MIDVIYAILFDNNVVLVQNNLVSLIAIGILLGSTFFAASNAYAHTPTSVSLSSETATQIKITWIHLSTSGADGCGSDCGSLADVDVMRDAVNIVNNATVQTYTDNSLKQGTNYTYKVCHPDPGTATCATSDTNETNAGLAGSVISATLPSKITSLSIAPGKFFTTLSWSPANFNNTHVTGEFKIDRSVHGLDSFANIVNNTSALKYIDTGVQPNTSYDYRMYALNAYIDKGVPHIVKINTLILSKPQASSEPKITKFAIGDITNDNLQVTVKEDSGWDRTLNVALYTNITQDQTKEDSNTYIIWNYFDPLVVSDPHGYFDDVNVVTTQSGPRTMDIAYEITWNKPLGANDAIIETSDFQRNVGTTIIKDAWKSFPIKQISYEIPEETSKEIIMTLFDGAVMNHLLLGGGTVQAILDGNEYFVHDKIIDVSQDVVVLQQEEEVIKLFEKFTLSQDNVKVGHKYFKTLVISGTLKDEFYQKGDSITFSISSPDGTESQITAVTTSARTFKVPIIIDEFESGSYQFQPIHSDLLGEPFFFKH